MATEPRGFFETPALLADFLSNWAIRSANDRILEPCAGSGVLVRSAQRRLRHFGCPRDGQIIAVERDRNLAQELARDTCVRVLFGDFLDLAADEIGRVDAVIANPPFVRIRLLKRRNREELTARFPEIPARASVWAYFLLHCKRFIEYGGRLAFVLPWELFTTEYGRRALHKTAKNFASVEVLQLHWPVFESAQVSTLLLLCEGEGQTSEIRLTHITDSALLEKRDLLVPRSSTAVTSLSLPRAYRRGFEPKIFDACRKIGFLPLREVAKVKIGFVTGRDSFFVLSEKEALNRRIPHCCLVRVISSPKQLSGLEICKKDWETIRDGGEQCYLLVPCEERNTDSHTGVRGYLERGRNIGVPKAFKCRSRPTWFKVKITDPPDAFLSYMNYGAPRLVVNAADLSGTNRLHHIYLRVTVSRGILKRFALAFLNPLTLTTVEVASRVYGGGVLKIEPGDCDQIWVPNVCDQRIKAIDRTVLKDVDSLLRLGEDWPAIDCASALLARLLSIPEATMSMARRIYQDLRDWRIGNRYAEVSPPTGGRADL